MHGDDVPEFLRVVIADRKPASERAVAEQNVLVLDTSMMDIYEGCAGPVQAEHA